MSHRILFVILLFLTMSSFGYADVQDELKGLNSKIREKQQQLNQTKKVETKVTTELQGIERNLKEKEKALAHLNSELRTVESGVVSSQRLIQQNIAELESKKKQISHRVVSLYKAGEMGDMRMFFSSESILQAIENRRYMKSVLENDRRLFQDYQNKIQQLSALKESLERDAARKEKLTAQVKSKKDEIENEKLKKSAMLTQVRHEKKQQQLSLKELQANARRLQAMVERLEARSRKSYNQKDERKKLVPGDYAQPPVADKGFGAQRGKLALPVSGEVVGRFGKHKHAEFNSFTISNGITISAPLNADIRSVYDGEVIFADNFKGYGNMLIIDHGGGYFTLYAHNARINKKAGASVRKNEVVAHVGDTDSVNGAQLYFEIRYQGRPIDPGPWLR